jgi:hypothetical protein
MTSVDWFVITVGLWVVAAALIVMALGSMHRGDHHDNGGQHG